MNGQTDQWNRVEPRHEAHKHSQLICGKEQRQHYGPKIIFSANGAEKHPSTYKKKLLDTGFSPFTKTNSKKKKKTRLKVDVDLNVNWGNDSQCGQPEPCPLPWPWAACAEPPHLPRRPRHPPRGVCTWLGPETHPGLASTCTCDHGPPLLLIYLELRTWRRASEQVNIRTAPQNFEMRAAQEAQL